MRAARIPNAMRWRRAYGVCAWAWAVFLTLGAASAAHADYSSRIGVMLGGGAYKLSGGGSDHSRIGPWATTGLRFTWTRKIDVEASYRYGWSSDDTQNYRTRATGFDLGLVYNGRPDESWTWQVFGGTGCLWWNVMDLRPVPGSPPPSTSPFASPPTANGFREDGNAARLLDSNWKVYLGLGGEVGVISNLTLRGGVRVDYLFKQTTDNTGASDTLNLNIENYNEVQEAAYARARVDANDLVPSAFAALTWWFGKRDRDDDGIADKDDACPDDPEDMDGFQDVDGCPEGDNDNDGILDATDNCPLEPEDKDGFEDEDGCPDLDNDKDNVPDAVDRCPTEPEDIDQFEDEDGCPDLDNDRDGVPDGTDQCPNTPPGTRVTPTGCPLSDHERQLFDTGMIQLRGVRFTSGKADIQPEFAVRLDSVMATVQRYPMMKLEVAGHTDSQGSEALNQRLSEQRAKAALDYLKAKDPNLDASRFTVRGYGESTPIADNRTEEGRSQNRRVEFRITNRAELEAEMQRRMEEAQQPAPAAAPVPTPAPTPAPETPSPAPDTPPAQPVEPQPDTPKPAAG